MKSKTMKLSESTNELYALRLLLLTHRRTEDISAQLTLKYDEAQRIIDLLLKVGLVEKKPYRNVYSITPAGEQALRNISTQGADNAQST